jgi:protein-L-isoaspartate O-methyltransferase
MDRFTLDRLPSRVLGELDLQTVFMASRLVIAAERLQVFRKLSGKSRSAAALRKVLGIHPAYSDYFLDALVSLGLLRKNGSLYRNSALGEKYFVKERSLSWTRQFSAECVETFESLAVLERVLKSGRSPLSIMRKKRADYVTQMTKDPHMARDFTLMLYHYHRGDADALARHLDLSAVRAVLDVGGGSGVMSLALAKKNAHLRACVLDIEPVCKVARQLIRREGLSRRVKALAGDMNKAFPPGYDVIMFCDVGRIRPSLLKRAFKSLPAGGMVVLVDRFMSDDRTRPLDRLLHQFVGSSFGVETPKDMTDALTVCGFRRIKRRKIHKDVWLITGLKTGK